MSAGIGGSNDKGTSNTQSTNTQQGSGTQTPNNLPFMQQGWEQASTALAPTMSTTPQLAGMGGAASVGAVAPAQATAAGGANADLNFANGDNVTNGANQYLTSYANGSQVKPNPGYNAMVGQIANSLQPQIDGPMAAAGRYGSGADANAFAGALTNEAGTLNYTNYAQQQQNQLAAAGQLSANNTAGRQQQLQGAAQVPGATSNLFTPGAGATAAAYAPLLAYIQGITSGNGGGSQTNQSVGTGHSDTQTTDTKVSASAGV
jgi:hypothetical protein